MYLLYIYLLKPLIFTTLFLETTSYLQASSKSSLNVKSSVKKSSINNYQWFNGEKHL